MGIGTGLAIAGTWIGVGIGGFGWGEATCGAIVTIVVMIFDVARSS